MIRTYSAKARRVGAWALITPLGLPVVPEVNIRSAMSSGRTASARARAWARLTAAAPARKSAQGWQQGAVLPPSPSSTIFSTQAGRTGASRAG